MIDGINGFTTDLVLPYPNGFMLRFPKWHNGVFSRSMVGQMSQCQGSQMVDESKVQLEKVQTILPFCEVLSFNVCECQKHTSNFSNLFLVINIEIWISTAKMKYRPWFNAFGLWFSSFETAHPTSPATAT